MLPCRPVLPAHVPPSFIPPFHAQPLPAPARSAANALFGGCLIHGLAALLTAGFWQAMRPFASRPPSLEAAVVAPRWDPGPWHKHNTAVLGPSHPSIVTCFQLMQLLQECLTLSRVLDGGPGLLALTALHNITPGTVIVARLDPWAAATAAVAAATPAPAHLLPKLSSIAPFFSPAGTSSLAALPVMNTFPG